MYSNAFNHSTFLQGGVDLRTGQYGLSLSLATLQSHFNRDVSRQIGLAFSMMNSADLGYGLGWALSGLTEYSDAEVAAHPTLSLSTGEYYHVYENGYDIIFKDKKGKGVWARKLDGRTICVAYRNGVIETLSRIADGQPLKLTKIQYENGESFDVAYQYLGPLICPSQITDAQGTSLLRFVSLNGASVDKIYVRIADERELEFDLTHRVNNYLLAISLRPDDGERALITEIEYETDFVAIKTVRNPLGGIEQLAYKADGHQVGGLSDTSYLPYVLQYTRIPGGGQPSALITYEYSSDHNFTGFPFNGNDPSETKDNLQSLEGEYDYWGREVLRNADGSAIRTHEVTYNRFHLTRADVLNVAGHVVSKAIQYNELLGQDFYAQPENVQVPSRIQITYAKPDGSSRVEVMTQQSDDYGNITLAVDNAGIQTINEYYPASGEPGLCPAEATGQFVRYLKQSTVTATSGAAALSRVTTHTYGTVATLHNQPFHANYAVVEVASTLGNAAAQTQSEYLTQPGSPLNAMLRQNTETFSSESGALATTTSYSYVLNGRSLTTTVTTAGSDGSVVQTSGTVDGYACQVLFDTSANGVTESNVYDGFGRLSQCISAYGSAYERTTTYRYLLSVGQPFRIETTNAWDVKSATLFDGFGRQIQHRQQDDDGVTERLMASMQYDNEGRALALAEHDYSDGMLIVTRTETYNYDSWGLESEVVRSDGMIGRTVNDPVLMTKSMVIQDSSGQSLSHTTETYNLFQKVARKDVYYADGVTLYRSTEYAYDAFGRPISITLPTGDSAYIDEYDLFNRPVRARHFDATSFSATYFPGATTPTPTSLSADIGGSIVSLGRQSFDGVGRLTGRSVNGCTMNYGYTAGTVPDTITNGRGQKVNIGFIPEIGRINRVSDNDSGYSFADYIISDASHPTLPPGVPLGSSSEASAIAFSYGTTGKLATITQSIGAESAVTLFNKWTLRGVVLDQTVDGRRQTFVLDDFGRVESKTDGEIEIICAKDSFGRAKSVTVKEGAVVQHVAMIELDEFDREVSRAISFPATGLQCEVQCAYDTLDRLERKQTAVGLDVVVERFTYDNRSRLIEYGVEGDYNADLLPRDSHGRAVIGQVFEYDQLNNLTRSVVTFADGGGSTSVYAYDTQKLVSVEQTNSDKRRSIEFALSYDADGNVVSLDDGGGAVDISYNSLNKRTRRAEDVFGYDAGGNLCMVGDTARFYYDKEIFRETNTAAQETIRHVSFGGQAIAQSLPSGGFSVIGIDYKGSVIASNQTSRVTLYTPSGEGSHAGLRRAFNGELIEAGESGYALGKGGRFYSPGLGVFLSLDSLAPFGVGEINPYRYCLGDPINNADPSGHMSVGSIFANIIGIIGSVVGIILAIPTGGASLTMTAGAGIVLGVVEIAATVTSIALEVAGNEMGSRIASGVAGVTGLLSGAAGSFGRLARPGKVKLLGNSNGALTGAEQLRSPASFGGYGNGNSLGPVPWQRQGRRNNQWHMDKGKKNSHGSRQRIYGSDTEISGYEIRTPLAELERRNSVRQGKRNIIIVTGSHGAADGNNWDVLGRRDLDLWAYDFYAEDIQGYLSKADHPMVRLADVRMYGEKQFKEKILDSNSHIILGYCYSRNDEALRYHMGLQPVTSYLSDRLPTDTYFGLLGLGRLSGSVIV